MLGKDKEKGGEKNKRHSEELMTPFLGEWLTNVDMPHEEPRKAKGHR